MPQTATICTPFFRIFEIKKCSIVIEGITSHSYFVAVSSIFEKYLLLQCVKRVKFDDSKRKVSKCYMI